MVNPFVSFVLTIRQTLPSNRKGTASQKQTSPVEKKRNSTPLSVMVTTADTWKKDRTPMMDPRMVEGQDSLIINVVRFMTAM